MPVLLRSVIRIRGVNPYIFVSRARVRTIREDWRGPLPVIVRLNGRRFLSWRTNMMSAGDGNYYLYLHGTIRRATETGVGDRVRVEIRFDRAYRGGPQEPTPRWFREALSARPRAARAWRALPPSRKKEIVRYFARLESAEARARNLARALRVLSGGSGRFMGRSWSGGS